MGVADGLSLSKVDPAYPREAIKKRIQGDVILMIRVDKQGKVTHTRVVSGDPLLAEAAVDAVKQWKYRPYLLDGETVEFETAVKIQCHM